MEIPAWLKRRQAENEKANKETVVEPKVKIEQAIPEEALEENSNGEETIPEEAELQAVVVVTCPRCGGDGWWKSNATGVRRASAVKLEDKNVNCPKCKGRGQL